MQKNNAVDSYVSGVKKLGARENPFADDITDDSPAERKREVTHSQASVRPRYGAYIAAAVLAVCIGVGAVFGIGHIGKDSGPADGAEASAPSADESAVSLGNDSSLSDDMPLMTDFTDAETACENYLEAEKASHSLLKNYDDALATGNDSDALRKSVYDTLCPYAEVCQAAVSYLTETPTSAAYYLLDVIKYEGEDTLSLSFINKTGKPIVLTGSGTAYRNDTGEKLCDLTVSVKTLPPDELSQIVIDTGEAALYDFNISLNVEDGTDISMRIDKANIIEALSRERIAELTRKLNEK